MEIFNIHLFEFLLIAGLALVVFGPERLPEIGRFIGQQVARFLAWQQQSPELKMLNEVRSDFEREIASLRDELVRTRNQLDIRSDVDAIREELRPMLDLKGTLKRETPSAANGAPAAQAKAPTAQANPPAAAPATAEGSTPPAAPPADAPSPQPASPAPEQPLDTGSAAPTVEAQAPASPPADPLSRTEPTSVLGPPRPVATNGPLDQPLDVRTEELAASDQQPHEASEPADATALDRDRADDPEHEQLLRRLDELTAQLHALVSELQGRGVIGADWRQPAPPEQETLSR